jgi:hypothetical protein
MFKWLWRQREGENYGPPSVEGNDFMAAFVGKALVFSGPRPAEAKM